MISVGYARESNKRRTSPIFEGRFFRINKLIVCCIF